MNILFPIAGRGQRFKSKNYETPKPLVVVGGKTLLEHAISTLGLVGNYIFISLRYEDSSLNTQIEDIIFKFQPNSKIILLDEPTRGMAETCLCAEEWIDNDEELIVTNVDQHLNWEADHFQQFLKEQTPDACVSTYDHEDIEVGKPSKYAFVKLNEQKNAVEFQEKFAISEHAMNGIYYWKHGRDFVSSSKQMISDNVTVNGEYYVSPSYNYMIREGKIIKAYKMNKNQFYSFGSPEEISNSLKYLTI